MVKNYVSLNSNTTLGFNKKATKKISTGNAFQVMSTSWFFMVLMLLGMAINQKAMANHLTKLVFTTSYTYHPVILKSSVAQGQSGGGGHGDPDWVAWHPLDVSRLGVLSGILNTKDYNNKNILHTLFNSIL